MRTRERLNFVPHHFKDWDDPTLATQKVSNFVLESKVVEEQWVVEITRRIGQWRSKSRSTYIRWALTINGLYLGEEKYGKWGAKQRFVVHTMRRNSIVPLAEWSGEEAAKNHKATAELVSAFGVVDLYGCLEEIVFDAYRLFLHHHPLEILPNPDYRELRQLYHRAKEDAAVRNQWESEWNRRLDHWHRKHLYDGLGKVFLAFAQRSGLKQPHWYELSTPETWAGTIRGIGELRNLITHGAGEVSKELSEFSKSPGNAGFDFKQGEPLVVELRHMMGVECFIDQLLTALNASLIECVRGPQPPLKAMLG